jgi:DNA-binding CsgD family transcriptional regulator/5-methylcytosine-specific restriction endonuclease McrA
VFVSATRAHVASLLAHGLSVAEIARRLDLAYTTISYHRDRLTEPVLDVPATAPRASQPLENHLRPVTTREEVHRLLTAGHSRAQVARELGVSKSTVTYHATRFGMNVDKRAARRYDWQVIQRYYDAGHTLQECVGRFGFSTAAWADAVKRGEIVSRARAMPISELLATTRNRDYLKRRLISAGLLSPQCQGCAITEWQGKPLSLQLHHINGQRYDHRLENLTLLCPNCHSQTKTWGGRNGRGEPRGVSGRGASQRAA